MPLSDKDFISKVHNNRITSKEAEMVPMEQILRLLPRYKALLLGFVVSYFDVTQVAKVIEFLGDKAISAISKPSRTSKMNALHFAARKGNAEVLDLLLKLLGENAKEVVKHLDGFGCTPLLRASMEKHPTCINLLLKAHKDEAQTFAGMYHETGSALHWAARNNCNKSMELLVDVLQEDAKGIISLPVGHYGKRTPLHDVVKSNNQSKTNLFIDILGPKAPEMIKSPAEAIYSRPKRSYWIPLDCIILDHDVNTLAKVLKILGTSAEALLMDNVDRVYPNFNYSIKGTALHLALKSRCSQKIDLILKTLGLANVIEIARKSNFLPTSSASITLFDYLPPAYWSKETLAAL